MLKLAASGYVINELGQILLIRRDDTRTWSFPGGSLDAGELPPDGAAREVEEETGLKTLPVRLVNIDFGPSSVGGFVLFGFRCLQRGGQLTPSPESPQLGFYAPKALPRPMFRLHRQRLHRVFKHQGGPPLLSETEVDWQWRLGWTALRYVVYPWKDLRRRLRGEPPFPEIHAWEAAAFTVIPNDEGEVLWVKRTDNGMWNLPGGGHENGEAPWQTAERETREETGLEVALEGLYGVYIKPEQNEVIFNFAARPTSGQLTTGPEAAEFAYFKPGREPSNSLPLHVERVADWATKPETAVFRRQTPPEI
jgi:ADP-ribose pyrophosphatase YjhB (NUDIX family)